MRAVLQQSADRGDSILSLRDTLDRVSREFPKRRACLPDREIVLANAEFHSSAVRIDAASDHSTAALAEIATAEKTIRDALMARVNRRNAAAPADFGWEKLLALRFAGEKNAQLSPQVEARARAEKVAALQTLVERRVSVLTGRAGTGKTSVLQVFLDALDQIEGRQSILLLAPTGKARVRLASKAGREALTIHQLLVRQEWLNPETFCFKRAGGKQVSAATVIIDEASMIPTDLIGSLFSAIDLNMVRRLVLVGDPNQLPPIGPGRPFLDIINWLAADEQRARCIARLTERVRHEAEDSRALQLADGYLSDSPPAGDDELLASVARGESQGDLDVHFWDDQTDLHRALEMQMKTLFSIQGERDYTNFNKSLGIDSQDWSGSERWQILSAVRGDVFGTTSLNRSIQKSYRGGLIESSKRKRPRAFGDEQLVWTDKVIQIANRRMRAVAGNGMDYVANGEIGIVTTTNASERGDSLEIVFSTQPDAVYRYFRGAVDENLELAYALTVHKAQGSDFDVVFLIVPQQAPTLSRELLYTGLTRFRRRLVLLVQRDIGSLERLRRPEFSQTLLRNSALFELNMRPDDVSIPFAGNLIHRTTTGILVRSKSEVIVADTLTRLGISYRYEERLPSKTNPNDFRLPDFSVGYAGDTYYWEHLGMLDVPSYRQGWERKLSWYEANGYADRVITSADRPDGGIDVPEIERVARERILQTT